MGNLYSAGFELPLPAAVRALSDAGSFVVGGFLFRQRACLVGLVYHLRGPRFRPAFVATGVAEAG